MKTIVRPSWRAFFYGGPLLLAPVPDLLLIALAGTPGRPLRAPAQRHQQFPDVPLVVANVELLLDQMHHPRTRPQRRLIAQHLRPPQQQFLQPFAILSIQTRLATGPSRLLQRRPARAAELHNPARHRLPDYFHAARHLGLIQSLLEESDRRKTPLLERIKIPSHSCWIAHA